MLTKTKLAAVAASLGALAVVANGVQTLGRIAAAIYANAPELDNAQLDEIASWINLYRSSR